MANGLLDRWKMRPEPLRPEVQLGPAFGARKGVNERNARLLQRNMAC